MTAVAGICGKLPARGDFVRRGLSRDFVDGWDAWWSRALRDAAARDAGWAAVWLAAPVWHFALAGGICGAAAVQGVVMPSVDAAGRYFPLTLAAQSHAGWDEAFLAAAEAVGREAIAADLTPDAIVARMSLPLGGERVEGCRFRTEGSPHVAPADFRHDQLPSAEMQLAMLNDHWRKDGA